MDLDQFKRAEALFDEAVQRPAIERERFVDEACGEDRTLRERVRRLLLHAERELVCEELESARRTASEGGAAAQVGDLSGTAIGAYSVLELLGEGGFGSVYRAEQHSPVRRQVALKVIKLGMDTAQVIARFDAERQALALMDHPHVARVFDAGVTGAGRPFVVMELVEGEPVTRFCDARRLGVAQRLRLFMQVCLAVQHAHGKGVIHRDLKPSNILVSVHDGVWTPKIIDFGIAKALHGRLGELTVATSLWQFIGTPEYMSPEQAGGSAADVDTRSDVYSLGVLLYELLVGATPFDTKSSGFPPPVEEVVRLILDHEPRRPSTRLSALGSRIDAVAASRSTDARGLRRLLKGDLDWIVLKAMAKDPSRRYQTAADLAHDIERFLDNRAVEARPPGTMYLAGKFVRRHRVAVSAIAAVAAALVLGLAAALVGWRQAIDAREGEREALSVARERLRDSLLAQAASARSGHDLGRRERALAAVSQAAQIGADDALRDEAIACLSLGDFELAARFPVIGEVRGAALPVVDRVAAATRSSMSLLSVPEGREIEALHGVHQRVWIVRFSRDGAWIVAKVHDGPGDARILVWAQGAQEPSLELRRASTDEALAVCTVQGHPAIAVGGAESRIEFLSLDDGRLLDALPLDAPPFSFAISEDGGRILISNRDLHRVSIWDLSARRRLLELDAQAPVGAVAWTPDGRHVLACGYDQKIYQWDAVDGSLVAVLEGHQGAVVAVEVSRDSTMAASFSWDGTTRLWDLRSHQSLATPLMNARVVAWGDLLVIDEGGQVAAWRYTPSDCFRVMDVASAPSPALALALSPDGRLLATAGTDGIGVRDTASGREVLRLSDEPGLFVEFLDGGRSLVAATADAIVRWTLDGPPTAPAVVERVELLAEQEGILVADIDASEQRLVVVRRQAIDVFALPEMELVRTLPSYRGLSAAASLDPSGRWLFTGNWRGDAARVWDLDSGDVVQQFPGEHVQGAFSPDGKGLMISTGAAHDLRTVGTWEQVRARLRNHTGDLAGHAVYSGDGGMAAVTDSRHDIHLVDVATGRTLARIIAPRPAFISRLALSADGSTLAAATTVDEVQVWNLAAMRAHLAEMGLDWEGPAIGSGAQ